MSRVTFLSAVDMSKVVEPAHVISIGSEGDWYAFACDHKALLRIEFDDVIGFVGSEGLSPFTIDQARLVLDFIKNADGAPITVHCQAGMSRSAAVAKFASDYFGYTLDLSPPCLGTVMYLNPHVYDTLCAANGSERTLKQYYAELELSSKQGG